MMYLLPMQCFRLVQEKNIADINYNMEHKLVIDKTVAYIIELDDIVLGTCTNFF